MSSSDRPLIRGERVWLRPMEERDLDAFRAAVDDREVGGWAGFRVPMGPEDARQWLTHRIELQKKGTSYTFTVCARGEDEYVGTVWLRDINKLDGTAELAICMDRDHVGGGWGTDAQRALLAFAFDTLRLHRVELGVDPDNVRAIRSYEKVGFRQEARPRSSWLDRGQRKDLLIMGILADEFTAPSED